MDVKLMLLVEQQSYKIMTHEKTKQNTYLLHVKLSPPLHVDAGMRARLPKVDYCRASIYLSAHRMNHYSGFRVQYAREPLS